MSKASKHTMKNDDDMLPEYDFSNAVRGKYAHRFPPDTIMVTLAPDVAAAFPDAKSVNEALRVLIKAARKSAPRHTSKKVAPAA